MAITGNSIKNDLKILMEDDPGNVDYMDNVSNVFKGKYFAFYYDNESEVWVGIEFVKTEDGIYGEYGNNFHLALNSFYESVISSLDLEYDREFKPVIETFNIFSGSSHEVFEKMEMIKKYFILVEELITLMNNYKN